MSAVALKTIRDELQAEGTKPWARQPFDRGWTKSPLGLEALKLTPEEHVVYEAVAKRCFIRRNADRAPGLVWLSFEELANVTHITVKRAKVAVDRLIGRQLLGRYVVNQKRVLYFVRDLPEEVVDASRELSRVPDPTDGMSDADYGALVYWLESEFSPSAG